MSLTITAHSSQHSKAEAFSRQKSGYLQQHHFNYLMCCKSFKLNLIENQHHESIAITCKNWSAYFRQSMELLLLVDSEIKPCTISTLSSTVQNHRDEVTVLVLTYILWYTFVCRYATCNTTYYNGVLYIIIPI